MINGLAVFDVDGTLTDSARTHIQFVNDINEEFGFGIRKVDPSDLDTARHFLVPPMANFLRKYGFPEDRIEELDAIYKERFPKMQEYAAKPFFGIKELLTELKANGRELAIITANTRANVQRDLGDLFDLFGNVIDREIMEFIGIRNKGEALVYLGAHYPYMKKEKISYTGDTSHDLRATMGYGFRFIGVSWGWANLTGKSEFGDYPVASSPKELGDIILR